MIDRTGYNNVPELVVYITTTCLVKVARNANTLCEYMLRSRSQSVNTIMLFFYRAATRAGKNHLFPKAKPGFLVIGSKNPF
jgi:hypothetical protein